MTTMRTVPPTFQMIKILSYFFFNIFKHETRSSGSTSFKFYKLDFNKFIFICLNRKYSSKYFILHALQIITS